MRDRQVYVDIKFDNVIMDELHVGFVNDYSYILSHLLVTSHTTNDVD